MPKSDILLVGSDGYIGSNCPFPCDKIDLKSGMDFLKAQIRQYKTIIFLATSTTENMSDKDRLANNQLYKRLDKWLRLYPGIHVIYSSSAAVYGENHSKKPTPENAYLKPLTTYGRSKLEGEYHVREYLNHTVLRFANVFGQMQGQPGHGVTEVFAQGGGVIFGDGLQVRDFVPISKVWQIIELALAYPEYWQGVYNLSLSRPMTINAWFQKIGDGSKPEHHDSRPGDIDYSLLNNQKLKEHIELCPQ